MTIPPVRSSAVAEYEIKGSISTKKQLTDLITILYFNVTSQVEGDIIPKDVLRQLCGNSLSVFIALSGQEVKVVNCNSDGEADVATSAVVSLTSMPKEKERVVTWIQDITSFITLPGAAPSEFDEVDRFIHVSMQTCFNISVNKDLAGILSDAIWSVQRSPHRPGQELPSSHGDTVTPYRTALAVVHGRYLEVQQGQFNRLQELFRRYQEEKTSLEGRIKSIPQPASRQVVVSTAGDIRSEVENRVLFNRLNTQLSILNKVWEKIKQRISEVNLNLTTLDGYFDDNAKSVFAPYIPSLAAKYVLSVGTTAFPALTLTGKKEAPGVADSV